MAFLRLAAICKEYKISKVQTQKVLKGISAEFKRGELVAILGESGCGKSTLLNIIGGLDTDYTGSIVLQDVFIRDYTETQMDDYRKKSIGLVFQSYNLISHMNLSENVEIALTMSNIDKATRRARAKELLELVGMEKYADKYPNQLSGGQKQRVAIARALANNPSIILADEPTGALDKESADAVMEIFRRIAAKGKLVLMVTHSQKIADACSRVLTIDDGVIVRDENRCKHEMSEYENQKRKNGATLRQEQKRENKQKRKMGNIGMREIWKLAFRNVLQAKGRNSLVAVGMAVGICAVILILCVSSGMSSYVNAKLAEENAGSMVLMVTKNGESFYDNDFDHIAELEGVADVRKEVMINYNASYLYGEKSDGIGALYTCSELCPPELIYGTLPAKNEVILNTALAATLTEEDISTLLGEEMTIRYSGSDVFVKIVGIYNDPTKRASEKNAFLSTETMDLLYTGDSTSLLYVTASDAEYIAALSSDLSSLGFVVVQIEASATEILEYIDIVTKILIAVGVVSLFVAAIMIFIVLYISVIERSGEIGIIRAIGGRKTDIRNIFTGESVLLGVAGGLIGCVLALAVSGLANLITQQSLSCSFVSYNPVYYVVGFVSCVVISVISGIAPAVFASNLDPAEALRSE